MSARGDWWTETARARVAATVRQIEAVTSAEVVVTVRAASWRSREADWLAGSLVAFTGLCLYLYLPYTFTDDLVAPVIVLLFMLGALVSAVCPPVQRALVGRARLAAAVRTAACEAFVDQGVSWTTGRSGVLVFVSLLERRVEVLDDLGVRRAALPPSWPRAIETLTRTLAARADLDLFVQALAGLAEPLGAALPRAEHDANELPDEVQA